MAAAIPPMDPRPMRTMRDMGMGAMKRGSMSGMDMDQGSMPGMDHAAMAGTSHGSMHRMSGMHASAEAKKLEGTVEADDVAEMPISR